jgi:hypothetical protein
LREAKRDLVGFVLCDRLDAPLQATPELAERMWRRREVENYLCQPETLLSHVQSSSREAAAGPLFEPVEAERRRTVMQECLDDFVPRAAMRDRADAWGHNTKASDDFLDRLFSAFFQKLGLPNLIRKTDYHVLARHVEPAQIDVEVREVLDALVSAASRAVPTLGV